MGASHRRRDGSGVSGHADAPLPCHTDEEYAALHDYAARTAAEFDNYRKRVARDAEADRGRVAGRLAERLIPVDDSVGYALKHASDESAAEGLRVIRRQLRDALAGLGCEVTEPLGEPFDPELHLALASVPSEDHPEGHVVSVARPGYRIGSHTVRPAEVAVSSGK